MFSGLGKQQSIKSWVLYGVLGLYGLGSRFGFWGWLSMAVYRDFSELVLASEDRNHT